MKYKEKHESACPHKNTFANQSLFPTQLVTSAEIFLLISCFKGCQEQISVECIQSCSAFSCVGYLTELKMEVSKELFRSLGSNTAKIYQIYGRVFWLFFFPTTRVENNNIYESLAQSLQQLQESTASHSAKPSPSYGFSLSQPHVSPTSKPGWGWHCDQTRHFAVSPLKADVTPA